MTNTTCNYVHMYQNLNNLPSGWNALKYQLYIFFIMLNLNSHKICLNWCTWIYSVNGKTRIVLDMNTFAWKKITWKMVTCQHRQVTCQHRQVMCQHRQVMCRHRQVTCWHRQVTCRHRQVTCWHRQVTCRHRQVTCQNRHVTCRHRHVTCWHGHVTCWHRQVTCRHRHVTCRHTDTVWLTSFYTKGSHCMPGWSYVYTTTTLYIIISTD